MTCLRGHEDERINRRKIKLQPMSVVEENRGKAVCAPLD
jgi:hypothetical protein